jgi:hypothetical protein
VGGGGEGYWEGLELGVWSLVVRLGVVKRTCPVLSVVRVLRGAVVHDLGGHGGGGGGSGVGGGSLAGLGG